MKSNQKRIRLDCHFRQVISTRYSERTHGKLKITLLLTDKLFFASRRTFSDFLDIFKSKLVRGEFQDFVVGIRDLMQPLQYINYTETGNTRKPTL